VARTWNGRAKGPVTPGEELSPRILQGRVPWKGSPRGPVLPLAVTLTFFFSFRSLGFSPGGRGCGRVRCPLYPASDKQLSAEPRVPWHSRVYLPSLSVGASWTRLPWRGQSREEQWARWQASLAEKDRTPECSRIPPFCPQNPHLRTSTLFHFGTHARRESLGWGSKEWGGAQYTEGTRDPEAPLLRCTAPHGGPDTQAT
jgi:hypothetical protein